MTKSIFCRLLITAVLASMLLTGCNSKHTALPGEDESVVFGPQYSPKKGLLVPKETRESLGLKIVEVEERRVSTTFDIEMRVYSVGSHSALASGAVSAGQAKLLKPGQPVEVRFRDGKTGTGRVEDVKDELLKSSGTFEIMIELPITSAEFETGMFIQARVTLDSKEEVVAIPRGALLQCSDGLSVYTVSGEHLVRTAIKIGNTNADFVEVKDGLYAGDKVVQQPVMPLWMAELAAVKGGQACCAEPAKGK